MSFTIALKAIISLTVGFVFWFWAFLVLMVYSFMPVSKMGNLIIFSIVAPLAYLVIMNLILKKLFKDRDWKNYLANFLITLGTTVFALVIIDFMSKAMR